MNLYEATIRERIELYVETIETEIAENEKLINRYKNKNDKNIAVLEYFTERLNKLKHDFETTKKVLSSL